MKAIIYICCCLFSLALACREEDEILTAAEPPPSPEVPSADTVDVSKPLDPPPPSINYENYQAASTEAMPYQILYPRNYNKNESYPILIFLHGIGQRGTDNKKQLEFGSTLFQMDSIRAKYPAFVVFPQCPESETWYEAWGVLNVKTLLDTLKNKFSIDENRVYIGGLSMGAYGTYAIVGEYPDLFAAAIAISGDGDDKKAKQMSRTKNWRIFAGKRDHVVESFKSEKMAKALKESGANVYLTVYEDADHKASWEKAFAEPDFSSWLFSKSRNDK